MDDSARGFVLAAARTPKPAPLTQPDQLLLIVPDLHLHLRVGRPLDLFRWTRNGEPISLDLELRSMLDLASDAHAETVQTGDMYEVWESEILLRRELKALEEHVHSCRAATPGLVVRTDVEQLLSSNRAPIDRLFSEESWSSWLAHTAPDRLQAAACVIAHDTESIQKWIRFKHQGLFRQATRLFTHELRGNHDNNGLNSYWEAWGDVAKTSPLRWDTKPSALDKRPDHLSLGRQNRVWIEHGHIYDWHNNDQDWWKESRGFSKVRSLVERWAFSDTSVQLARWLADEWTDRWNYEMRFPELLRADEILLGMEARSADGRVAVPKTVSLVVMGHTHAPCLIEAPRGTSLFCLHPHARKYLDSGYCLDDARRIATALAHPAMTSG